MEYKRHGNIKLILQLPAIGTTFNNTLINLTINGIKARVDVKNFIHDHRMVE